MKELLQIITAFIGSLGFALLFHIRGKKVVLIGLGGTLSWSVFLVSNSMLRDLNLGLLCASIAATLLAEMMARLLKTPVILLLVPMLVPMIPGGDLYYTMNALIVGNMAKFGSMLATVVQEALAIAFGMILVASLAQLLQKTKRYRERDRKNPPESAKQ